MQRYAARKCDQTLIGYLIGAALMIVGAIVEAFLGVDAERKSLEHVATPLSCKL